MTVLLGVQVGRPLPGWVHAVAVVAGTGAVVFVLGVAALDIAARHAELSAWWPAAAPAALGVAAAASGWVPGWDTRRRQALLVGGVLLAVGLAGFGLRLGRPPDAVTGWALADVAQAGVAGTLLGRRGGPALRGPADLGRLLLAALAGAVAAGVVAVLDAPPGLADRPGPLFWSMAASRAAPVLLLIPLVLPLPRRRRRRGRLEASAWWLLVVATTVATFAPGQWLPLTFLPMAVLVGAGLRLAPRAVMCQMVMVGVLITVLSARGAGPFAAGFAPVPVAMVQTFLVVCVLAVLALTLTVAQRDDALDALADQRQFDRGVLEGIGAGVLACDADGAVVLRNAAHRRVTGLGDGPVVDPEPLAAASRVHPDGTPIPAERTPLHRALAGEEVADVQLQLGPPGAPPHHVVAAARPIWADDGRLLGAVATYNDVTRERAVQSRLRRAVTFRDAVLAASPDIIFVTDAATHRVVWTSRTVEAMLGVTPQQVLRLDHAPRAEQLVHPDDRAALHAADDAGTRLRDGEVTTVRVRMRNAAGAYRWLARRVTPFTRDASGRVVQLLGVSRDVTDVVAYEDRLAHAASHDPLTGLLNRRALGERLAAVVARAEDDAAQIPVLFCDLDGFKAVNDSAGHAAGDALLVAAARRIAAALRAGDTLARPGGDEFVVLLEAAPRHRDPGSRPVDPAAEALHHARAVARRIAESLARPMDIHGTEHRLTVSIGIALARPGQRADDVLDDADTAMYRAKSAGRNRHHVFEVAPPRRGDPPGAG